MISSSPKRWVAKGVGSRRPSDTSSRRVGVDVVSTSPVVMVMLLIQSVSRWSVAGVPWTPTLATCPRQGHELGTKLEGLRYPDRLYHHVSPEPAGDLHDLLHSVFRRVVYGHVRTELPGALQPPRCPRSMAITRP